MNDANPNLDPATDLKPQDQTGEENGSVKGPQATGNNGRGKDLPAGAEGDVRRTTHGAR